MHSLTYAKLRKPRELRIHCDEAGRGPLAGPVTVGCTVMIDKTDLSAYKDSKQLTAKQREFLYDQIKSDQPQKSLFSATGWASAQEIDMHGIVYAINLACRRGIGELLKIYYIQQLRDELLSSDFGEDILVVGYFDQLFSQPVDEDTVTKRQRIPNSYAFIPGLIRDGNHTFGLEKMLNIPVVTIIKGDQKNPLISAASIVAKVERDRYMADLARQFPVYGFEKHKGYGSKLHRDILQKKGSSRVHRVTFCKNITHKKTVKQQKTSDQLPVSSQVLLPTQKPALLLHICCAPDLSRPLHRLKEHFKLYLFRYNPNIHPRKEHEQRYSQFLKLVGLEPGDYEILEDRYDPKEFFQAMIDQKESIDPLLINASDKEVLQKAGEMEERSDRCNPCYSSRLVTAANMAAQHNIPYFTSTLLISPKKIMEKLYQRGKDAEETYPTTKFLRFDFPKNGGYQKAVELTRTHGLRRQNYCGCGRTIPKPGERKEGYHGG